MKLKKLSSALTGMGLAAGLLFAGQAQAAFLIDNFDVDTASNVTDNVVGGVVGPVATTVDDGNIVMGLDSSPTPFIPTGWSRTISADLSAGDSMSTQVCANCDAGHLVAGAGGSVGISQWIYNNDSGSNIDLSAYTSVFFDYAADLDGGDIDIIFADGSGSDTLTLSWADLANTNNSSDITNAANRTTVGAMAFGSAGAFDASDIANVTIQLTGVADLDFSIDDVTAVPEPATLALLGLGLAGVGWQRRRSKA